jgi:hypothetical protein
VEVALGGVVAAVVAGLVTLWTQRRQRAAGRALLNRELEHQTREALRRTYAELLVAQRRSREASLRLAEAGGAAAAEPLAAEAVAAHAEFIDRYHQLNLDSSREMWLEARGLRDVLGRMLELGRAGRTAECKRVAKVARDARQNLERSFRNRLGYEGHQARRKLGKFDKVDRVTRSSRSPVPGEPSHFEVGVADAMKARRFYGELLGWSYETTRADDAWIETGGVRGGVHGEDADSTIVLYFSVPDLDDAALRVRELGGEAPDPGEADPSGRYAQCRDDQGVVFGLHQPPAY